MSYYQELSAADEAELHRLNIEVDRAIEQRKAWLDERMHSLSELKIGDPIYDLDLGKRVGVVSRIYRYHRDDPRYDRSLYWDYEFHTGDNCYDNTSRQPERRFGTAQQALAVARERMIQIEQLEAEQLEAKA